MPRQRETWSDDGGQDIAEYAVVLMLILVLVVGAVRLVGGNSNAVFSRVADVFEHHSDAD